MRRSRRGRRRLIVLGMLGAIVGGVVLVLAQVRGYQQRRLVHQARTDGLAAQAAGNPARAVESLAFAYQHHPDDIEVTLAFADARMQLVEPDGRHVPESLALYRSALELMASDAEKRFEHRRAEVQAKLLDLYRLVGLNVEVIETADELLEADPSNEAAMSAKANALIREKRFDEAEPIVQALERIDPHNLSWRLMELEVQRERGASQDEQLALCEQWELEQPPDGRFLMLQAMVLAEAGELERARELMRQCVERGAETLEVLQHAVAMLDLLDERVLADELILRAQARFPGDVWVREAAVRREWLAGRIREGFEALEAAEAALPQTSDGLAMLRVLLLMAEDRSADTIAAVKTLEARAERSAQREAIRAWTSAILARLGAGKATWLERTESMRRALVMLPRDAALHFLLGESMSEAGETVEAVRCFERAFVLEPAWVAAGVALAESLRTSGRVHDALDVSRTVLARAPRELPAPYLVFAACYLDVAEVGGAAQPLTADDVGRSGVLAMLESLHQQLPDDDRTLVLLVRARALAGHKEQASALIESLGARSAAPTADVLLELADVSQRFGLGHEERLAAHAAESGDSAGVLAAAMLSAHAGRPADGLDLLDAAIQAAATEDARFTLGRLRVAFLDRIDDPRAVEAARELVNSREHSIIDQQFALGLSCVWSDERLVSGIAANLGKLAGPRSDLAQLAQAAALLQFHDHEEAELARAIVLINDVLERSPESLTALMLAADAELAGRAPSPSRAADLLDRATSLYPQQADVLVRLIDLRQQQGDYAAAARALDRLARVNAASGAARGQELRLLERQGDAQAALARAREVVSERSDVRDQLVLARLHRRAGETAQAEAIYRRLIALENASDLALADAAAFLASTNRLEEGRALLHDYESRAGTASSVMLLASFLAEHGRLDQAITRLEALVSREPQAVDAHVLLARLKLSSGDREGARESATIALRAQPRHAGAQAVLAMASLGTDDAEARTRAIEQLSVLDPRNTDLVATLRLLNDVPVRGGRLAPDDEALARARRLVDAHGGFMPAWMLAITLHAEAGKRNEAASLARRAVNRFPTSAEPCAWSTNMLMDLGRWRDALVEAMEWKRRSDGFDPKPDLALVRVHLHMGNATEAAAAAEPHLERSLVEHADGSAAALDIVRAFACAGRWREIEQRLEPLLSNDPVARGSWLDGAALLPFDQARTALDTASQRAATSGERLAVVGAWIALGRRTGQSQAFDAAAALLDQPLDDRVLAADAAIMRGVLLEARGDTGGAATAYRAALSADPNHLAALNNLACLLAEEPAAQAEARTLIERAIAIARTTSQQAFELELVDSQALILLAGDRPADAERLVSAALKSNDLHYDLRLRLAEAEAALGNLRASRMNLDAVDAALGQACSVDLELRERIAGLRAQLEVAGSAEAAATHETNE